MRRILFRLLRENTLKVESPWGGSVFEAEGLVSLIGVLLALLLLVL